MMLISVQLALKTNTLMPMENVYVMMDTQKILKENVLKTIITILKDVLTSVNNNSKYNYNIIYLNILIFIYNE